MVQTRSGRAATGSESVPRTRHPKATGKKETIGDSDTSRPTETLADDSTAKEEASTTIPEKRKRNDDAENGETRKTQAIESPSQPEEQRPVKVDVESEKGVENGADEENDSNSKHLSSVKHKIYKTIAEYGTLPLDGTGVDSPLKPTPEILLAIVIDSMLKSTRISHLLAQRASNRVFKAGYHDIKVLSSASWDDKVQVLSEGGYNRYRETAATKLGDLARLINEKYDGDLNNLLEKANHDPSRIRSLIREIKGFGDIATELFCDDAQAVWPILAPTIDHRSLDTAKEVGIGNDIQAIFDALDRDPVQMSKLARGLSAVRLKKEQDVIEQE